MQWHVAPCLWVLQPESCGGDDLCDDAVLLGLAAVRVDWVGAERSVGCRIGGYAVVALQGRTLLDKLYCICLIPWRLCRVPRGEIPEQKTDAYISGVWYTIARNQMKYNSTDKQRTFENLAGNKGAELIDTVAEFLV